MVGASASPTTIVLASPYDLIRGTLHERLDSFDFFQVLESSGNGETIQDVVQDLRPDLLITEIDLLGLNGLELLRTSVNTSETTGLVLSHRAGRYHVLAAFRNGAKGYVTKTDDWEVLTDAIQAVSSGGDYLSSRLSVSLSKIREHARNLGSVKSSQGLLTDRETEVLKWVSRGLSSAEIGRKLCISTRTVEVHRRSLMEKLNSQNAADLIRTAFQERLLSFQSTKDS